MKKLGIASGIVAAIVLIVSVWLGYAKDACPVCWKRDKVIPIVYGNAPFQGDPLENNPQLAKSGQLNNYYAGCTSGIDRLYCRRCHKKFF